MLEARDVGKAMERLRGDRTQREVAGRARINRSSWSNYEAGRRMPSASSWPRIARGLGCSEADLDLAVLRAWGERLAEAEGAPRPLFGDRRTGERVGLDENELLDLATASERISAIARGVLGRRSVAASTSSD